MPTAACTGGFDSEPAGDDNIRDEFRGAGIRLNEDGGILGHGSDSRVLDVGCGNGTNVVWVHRNTGAHATGIDLSGVRIANAALLWNTCLTSPGKWHLRRPRY